MYLFLKLEKINIRGVYEYGVVCMIYFSCYVGGFYGYFLFIS